MTGIPKEMNMRALRQKLDSSARRFRRDKQGSVLVMFPFILMICVGFAALAIDGGQFYLLKNKLQTTADASALAAIGDLPDTDAARATAVELATNNMSVAEHGTVLAGTDIATGTWDFEARTFTPGGTPRNAVRVVTRRSRDNGNPVRPLFASALGFEETDIAVTAIAATGSAGMELIMVLDVSGSMSGDIPALRQAATNLLDVIFQGNPTRPKTWVGLAPFGGRVNIIDYGESWMNSPPSESNGPTAPGVGNKCKFQNPSPNHPRLCTALRSGVYPETAAPPSFEGFDEFGGDLVVCPVPKAVGLTSSRDTVQQAVDQLCAGHGTSTEIGMVWGWRMLSPEWQGLWGDPELPLDYDDTPGKYVVIMTDGGNHPSQSGDPYSSSEADAQLLRECQAMKDEGITIFAVTFNMDGALAALYQQCVSDPAYQYDAESDYDLEEVFGVIGNIVNTLGTKLVK